MNTSRNGPRAEYLAQEKVRIDASPALSDKYPQLLSLIVDLGFYDPEARHCSSQIKYTVSLDNAKSIFWFGCHNPECVQGAFDLSSVLADSVATSKTKAVGELRCPGWRTRAGIGNVHCNNLLRYTLTLKY